MAADVTAFAGIQTAAAALKTNPKTGTGLSDQTAADMGIGVTGFVDAVPVPPPVVAYINDGKDADGTITTSLNNIAAIDGAADTGGIMAGIKIATQDELQASGFIDNADDYANYVTKISALNNSSPQSQEQVLKSIFGDNFDIPGLEDELKRIRNFQKAGLITTTDPVMDLLDADRDGKLDSPDKLKAAFLGKISKDGRPMTIKEMLAGNTTVTKLNDIINGITNGRKKLTTTLTDIPKGMTGPQWDSFREVFKDGTLSDTEVSLLKDDTLVDLEALSKLPGASNNTALRDLIRTKRREWAKGLAQPALNGMQNAPKENRYGRDRTITDKWMESARSVLDSFKVQLETGSDSDKAAINLYLNSFRTDAQSQLHNEARSELADIESRRASLRNSARSTSQRPDSIGMINVNQQDSVSGGERARRNALRDADRDYDNTIRRYYNYFDKLGIRYPPRFPKHPDRR